MNLVLHSIQPRLLTNFFSSGYDVVMSGIDTTEALTEAKKLSDAGQKVWAVSYDYKNNCAAQLQMSAWVFHISTGVLG